MATTSQIVDEVVFETRINDQSTAGVEAAEKALGKYDAAAKAAAAASRILSGAASGAGDGIGAAATSFQQTASRVDDVTRAYNTLKRAQDTLAMAQSAANREIAAGRADMDQVGRTLAELASRVETAAEKLGEARAEATANAEATAAWNGVLAQGAQAMGTFATGVAAQTQAMREEENAARSAAAAQSDLNRILGINVDGRGWKDAATYAQQVSDGTDRLRASISPAFAALQTLDAELTKVSNAEKIGAGTADEQAAARVRANETYAKTISLLDGTAASAQAAASAFAAIDQLQQKWGSETAAVRQAIDAQTEINGLLGAGLISAEEAETALDGVTESYRKMATAAASAALAAAGPTPQAVAKLQPAALEDLNKDDPNYQRQAADAAAYGSALDALRGKIDPLFRASKQYEAVLDEIDLREKQEIITVTQAASARQQATAAFASANAPLKATADNLEGVGTSSRNANTQMRLLGVQAIQTFSGLSTGQPVMTTLIQQGHQVADSLLATGVGFGVLKGAISGAISAIVSPIGLLVAGVASVTVGLYELIKAGEASLSTLATVQQAVRGNHADFEALGQTVVDVARKVAASSGLGLDEALQVAKTFAANKYFSGTAADLERLTRDADDLSEKFGGTQQAAKFLTDALADPSKAAQSVADVFSKTLNPELLRQIDLMQKAGNQNGAYVTLLKGLESAAGGAARNGLGPIAKAWQDLGNAFTSSTNGWKPFEEWLAKDFALALSNIASAITGVSDAWKALKSGLSQDQGIVTLPSTAGTAPGQISATPTTSATKDAFVTQWLDAAKTAGSQLGVSPQVLLSQWGLETGWGQSAYNNNLGNIKPGTGYTGQTFINPGDNTAYRSYATPQAFADDYTSLIQQRYPNALNAGSNATAYGQALQAGGYATDPNYASKIASTAASLQIPGNIASDTAAATDALKKYVDESRALKDQQLDASWQAMSDDLVRLATTTGTSTTEFAALKQKMEENRAERYKNVDAITQEQRATESSLRSTAGQTAADQALSAALEARNQASLNSRGAELSAADAAQVHANVLAVQNQELGRTEVAMARSTANTVLMAEAYDKGNQAVIDATADQAAYNKALELFGQNVPAGKLEELTAFYKNSAKAAADAKTAQANLNSRDNIAYIQEETATLGMNEDARNRQLAIMKAQQAAGVQYGDTLTKEAQESIRLAAATADATSAFQHQQAVNSELGTFFTNTFDTISNSITSAFANGTESALKFKDIAKSVASAVLSEFVKLAVVNPLKSLLFGSTNSTVTISDVLGLLGGASSIGASASGSGASGIANLVFTDGSKVATSVAGADASGASSSGGAGVLGTASGVVTIAGAAGKSGLFGDLFKDLPFNNLSSFGSWIVSNTISTLGGEVALKAATTAATNAALGTIGVADGSGAVAGALAIPGAAVQGVIAPTAGQVAGAAVGQAVGLSDAGTAALSTAAGQVVSALPYIGVAISLISDLAQGNFRGAGLVAGGAATGAAVGTFVFPGLGTAVGAAVGAAVGGLVDTFFPGHALNSYQGTEVMVQNGQVVAGKTASQVQSSDSAVSSINDFGTALNTYMDKVGIVLTNLNGTLGDVGQGIAGLTQYTSVQDPAILSKLQFAGNSNDTSNFGVAKGALVDMQFSSIGDLTTELLKIAGFADAASAMGIQLAHVAKDISNIQIASVSGGNANALGSVTDATGNVVQYHNDLRTALNTDLPGQTFADTTALDTEISKVNTFVSETLPQLLTPIEKTSSSITTAVDGIDKTYNEAIAQSLQYGLDNTAILREAEAEAISIVRRTALMSLTQDYTSIINRFLVATNDNVYTQQQATLDALRATQANEIETFTKSWTDIFGDGVKSTSAFQASLQGLTDTLGAEFTVKVNATNKAIQAAQTSISQTLAGYSARDEAANGNQEGSDLISADVKAAQERQSFIDSFDSTYGQLAESGQYFQDSMVLIDKVHAEERLAIEKKYATDSTTALTTALDTTLTQAQGQVTSLLGNLTSYAHTLQSGADSPLSPTAQYALASSQFDAVASAAKAGDYNSASQLQTYAQNLQTASRSVYGSGTQYAADVTRVLDAISGTAATADMLTLSAQQALIREQTQAQVDAAQKTTDAVTALQAEVAALRREMSNQSRLAALAA